MKQGKSLASHAALFFAGLLVITSCSENKKQEKRIKQIDPIVAAERTKEIEAMVKPQLAEGLTLKLWAMDSLLADPVSIDIDDEGRLYYTRTNRQKSSEFDIRAHRDWEIESIALQSIEDKRNFLRKTLAPENSDKNKWLDDVNKDGSRDWRDMTVQQEHVYRIEDASGDGIADRAQLVISDFHDEVTDAAGGVLKHGDDLFVAIGPDLWKVNDTDGDGVADSKKSLSHGYGIHIGFSGHGMSGIEVGPEGKIYWQIGDIGFNGVGPDGQKWEHPNSGVIVRCNPDGSDFEVFAYGNRNTHEFVFDEYGNMISVDNDGDHPDEMERLVYVVNGGDIGWRTNWQFGKYNDPDNNTYKVWMDEKMYKPRFEGQAAYIVPSIAQYINGPTGMLYNPGTALSKKWNNTFFVVEFVGNPAQSGVHAFKLQPDGATFKLGETQKILGGVLATGLDFGPDGALYVADWIDGWNTKDRGRVWKLDADDPNPERKKTAELLRADLTKYNDKELASLLRNEDMRVRQKAQFELATRGDAGLAVFKAAIEQKTNQLERIHGIVGIRQMATKHHRHGALLLPLLKDNDPEIRAQAAKWLGDVRYKEGGTELLPLLKDTYPRAQFFAAEALGRIAHRPAVDPIISLLESNNEADAYIRHACALALARIGDAQPLVALSTHRSKAVRIGAVVALRRLRDPGIAAFLNDKDEFVVTEAARAINDDLSIVEALPALGNVVRTTKFTNEALLRRAINANLRAGTDSAMQNLIQYAARQDQPSAMRAEAIAALSTWAKPSVVDRVDGRYRGVVERDPAKLVAQSKRLLDLLNDKEVAVRIAAVRAIGKLNIKEGVTPLIARLSKDSSPDVRREALQVLGSLADESLGHAIQIALADTEKSVRVVALDLLPKSNLPKTEMVTLLADVINTRTVEEKQAALLTLGTLPLENSSAVFDKLLVQMKGNKLPVEIQLELAEAIDSTKSVALRKQYKEILVATSPDTVYAPYKAALQGGNPRRGADIFYSHQTAQCIRCHSYGDYGGNAGPRLNGVASRLTREQLLEALVDPSARIAPGYGMISVALSNGKKLSGILQEEKENQLRLKVGNADTLINNLDVVHRTNPASSMPPMRLLLTKKEIRDIVSFLATMKE